MLFLKVFKLSDNFDSKLRQFHIVAPLYEKHFWSLADFRMGISKSGLVLRNSLLHVSKSLENISVRKHRKYSFSSHLQPCLINISLCFYFQVTVVPESRATIAKHTKRFSVRHSYV